MLTQIVNYTYNTIFLVNLLQGTLYNFSSKDKVSNTKYLSDSENEIVFLSLHREKIQIINT